MPALSERPGADLLEFVMAEMATADLRAIARAYMAVADEVEALTNT